MCEIAILNPDRFDTAGLVRAAKQLYRSQRSALGLVAIFDEQGEFRYETYRSTNPPRDELWEFFSMNFEAWRVIIHGRMATSSPYDNDGTHPIEIDCPECDIDYVLHNGIISGDKWARGQLEQADHEFTTEVDTEVIAHSLGTVPDDPDEAAELLDEHRQIASQPAFILLNSSRVFISVRPGGWHTYNLVDGAEMYKPRRWFSLDDYDGDYYNSYVVYPGTEAPTDTVTA